MRILAWVMGAALLLPSAAGAADPGFPVRNTGDLAQICAGQMPAGEKVAAMNFCHGYAQGVVSLEMRHDQHAFCVPTPSPSRTQTMNEFVTWARADASRLSQPPTEGLIAFFRQRFPCNR